MRYSNVMCVVYSTPELASAPAGVPGRRVHLGSVHRLGDRKRAQEDQRLSTVLRLQSQYNHVVDEPAPGTEALAVTVGSPSPVLFCLHFDILIHTPERARHHLRTANGRDENKTFNFQSSSMYELALEARRQRLGKAPDAKPILARKKVDDNGASQPRDLHEAVKGTYLRSRQLAAPRAHLFLPSGV